MRKNLMIISLLLSCTIATIVSCKKSDYFINGGLSKGDFSGNTLEYLQSNPFLFDTLVRIIDHAGLNSYFTDSTITFFAPADSSISATFNYINRRLKGSGLDTLTSLEQIKPEFWKNTLMMYMFRGAKGLEDYAQLDRANMSAYPGEFVRSLGGRVMNIGVVFADASGLKYQGYRSLNLSYIFNTAQPFQNWRTQRVATSNIKPKNGYVHVLVYRDHFFGFDAEQAWLNAGYLGFDY